MRMRLTMNPGRSADTMTCLPSSPGSVADRRRPSRRACRRTRISSTSGMTGTGLKKCIPTNRARRVRARPPRPAGGSRSSSCSRRRSPSAGATRRARATARRLTAEVLEDRLDDEVGVAPRPRGRRSAAIRAERRVALGRSSSRPLATARSRLPAMRSRPASARARSGSYSTTVLADRGVDLGDAVAHQPGAGHEHALDRHVRSVAARSRRSAATAPAPSRAAAATIRSTAAAERDRGRTRGRSTPEPRVADDQPEDRRARARTTRSRKALVGPDDGRRAPSRRHAGHGERQERREHERDADREDGRPDEQARPASGPGRGSPARRRSRRAPSPTAAPAPTWSGSLAKTIRSTTTISAYRARAGPRHPGRRRWRRAGGTRRTRPSPTCRQDRGSPGRMPAGWMSGARGGRSPVRALVERRRRGLRHEQGQAGRERGDRQRRRATTAVRTRRRPGSVSPMNGRSPRPR